MSRTAPSVSISYSQANKLEKVAQQPQPQKKDNYLSDQEKEAFKNILMEARGLFIGINRALDGRSPRELPGESIYQKLNSNVPSVTASQAAGILYNLQNSVTPTLASKCQALISTLQK